MSKLARFAAETPRLSGRVAARLRAFSAQVTAVELLNLFLVLLLKTKVDPAVDHERVGPFHRG